MWKETAAVSYKGLEELSNSIILHPSLSGPTLCVRIVYGDCKPYDSFQKAHVIIERKMQLCSGR